ncbi:MAG: GntR family transcriptional regulator [Anaerolineae bacterium]|jgi:DNA-binding GntR family transcriptional regulator|nr:GntR family transcriptional regulator [Anaerolineae bacterium]MDX9831353.1 GntR family transcriptional regulator [Anaerolineae bacterium]
MQRRDELSLQEIYDELRTRITLLRYPPGTALSENVLAQEFGVSRTPIRRILQQLEFEGLVETKRGIGTIVTTIDLKLLKDVYALRKKLHEVTGELCPVVHASERDLEAISDLCRQVAETRTHYAPQTLARLYNTFQEKMLDLISNEPLRRVSEILYYQTARLWLQLLPELNWADEVDYVVDEVTQVVDALRARDMRTVGQIRCRHLAMNLNRMLAEEAPVLEP